MVYSSVDVRGARVPYLHLLGNCGTNRRISTWDEGKSIRCGLYLYSCQIISCIADNFQHAELI